MNTPTSIRNHSIRPHNFPMPATYCIAGRVEPVIVLGLGGHGELRIIDRHGYFRTVGEHRVRLERAS
jgi:hypothetical protein